MSSERRPDRSPPRADARPARRVANRHYLALVAAEARRLGRQLRTSPSTGGADHPTIGGYATPQRPH
jgi:hypothetical protein